MSCVDFASLSLSAPFSLFSNSFRKQELSFNISVHVIQTADAHIEK